MADTTGTANGVPFGTALDGVVPGLTWDQFTQGVNSGPSNYVGGGGYVPGLGYVGAGYGTAGAMPQGEGQGFSQVAAGTPYQTYAQETDPNHQNVYTRNPDGTVSSQNQTVNNDSWLSKLVFDNLIPDAIIGVSGAGLAGGALAGAGLLGEGAAAAAAPTTEGSLGALGGGGTSAAGSLTNGALASQAAYDSELAGVGSNVGAEGSGLGSLTGSGALESQAAYDAGLNGVGSNLGAESSLTGDGSLASQSAYDSGLNGVGSNVTSPTTADYSGGFSDARDTPIDYNGGLSGASNTPTLGGVLSGNASMSDLPSWAQALLKPENLLKLGTSGIGLLSSVLSKRPTGAGATTNPAASLGGTGGSLMATTPGLAASLATAAANKAGGGTRTYNPYTGNPVKLMETNGGWNYFPTTTPPAAAPAAIPTNWQSQFNSLTPAQSQTLLSALSSNSGASMAHGGQVNGLASLGPDMVPMHAGPGFVQGPGTGQSDSVPANLSHGEYVVDADTVSNLGDGSNDAGAAKLDQFRQSLRAHKRSAPATAIPPKAKSINSYMG